MNNKDNLENNSGMELEGIPTHVQSLFAQHDDIDFDFKDLLTNNK